MSRRIVIPSGSIPEGRTSVIEIPSQNQGSNILIASPRYEDSYSSSPGGSIRPRRRRLDFSDDSDPCDDGRTCWSAPGSPLPGFSSFLEDSSSAAANISVRSAPSPHRPKSPSRRPRRDSPQSPCDSCVQEPVAGPSQRQGSQPPPKPPRRFLPRPTEAPPPPPIPAPPPPRKRQAPQPPQKRQAPQPPQKRQAPQPPQKLQVPQPPRKRQAPQPPISRQPSAGPAQVQRPTVPPPPPPWRVIPPSLYAPKPPPRTEMHDYSKLASQIEYQKFAENIPSQKLALPDAYARLGPSRVDWRAQKFQNLLSENNWTDMDDYIYDMERLKFEYDKRKYQKCRKNFVYNVSKVTCDAFKTVTSQKYRQKKKSEKRSAQLPEMNLPYSTPERK